MKRIHFENICEYQKYEDLTDQYGWNMSSFIHFLNNPHLYIDIPIHLYIF